MMNLSDEQKSRIERNKLEAKSKRMAKEIEEKKQLALNKRLARDLELKKQAALEKRRNNNHNKVDKKVIPAPELKRIKYDYNSFEELKIKSREEIKYPQKIPQNMLPQRVPTSLVNIHQVPESKPILNIPQKIENAPKPETSLKIELVSPENLHVSIKKTEKTTISILRNCEYTVFDNKAKDNFECLKYNLSYVNLECFIKYLYSKQIKDILNVNLPLQRSSLQPLLKYSLVRHELDRQETALDTFANYAQIRTRLDLSLSSALHEHQKTALERTIASNGRLLIGDDMGLGKTLVAIGAAQYYHKRLKTKTLIIAPKSMIHTWKSEIVKWSPESFRPSEIQIFEKGNQEMIDKAKVTIITYDMFTRINSSSSKFRSWAFQCLMILDESHSTKNAKSNKTKTINDYAQNVAKFIILLSGTPALNKPIELYSQISMVRPDVFSSSSGKITQKKFSVRYCDEKVRYLNNGKKIIVNSGCSNVSELKTYLDVFVMIRREKGEVSSAAGTSSTENIELPPKKRFIKKLDTEIRLNDVEVVEDYNSRCDQAKNNSKKAYLNAIMDFYQKSASIKLPVVSKYILSKIKRHQDKNQFNKIVIFAHHQTMLDGLEEALIKNKINFIRIDGKTDLTSRGELIEDFQREDKNSPLVAIISIIAGNAGITLTQANLVIFAELNWTPGYMAQAEDRVHRIGQKKPVTIEILICSQTVDNHIWRLLKEKTQTLVSIGMGKSSAMDIVSVDDVLNASAISDDSLNYKSIEFDENDDDYMELVNFEFSQVNNSMEKLSTQDLMKTPEKDK